MKLEKIEKPYLLGDYYQNGYRQRIYLESSFYKENQRRQYFLKLYKVLLNGDYLCQGYLYFYVDFILQKSEYIGSYVRPEYRGCGFSAFLISLWLQLCFEQNIDNLRTIRNQRKPFLLYLLTKYSFEVINKDIYSPLRNIHICKGKNPDYKYLWFENSLFATSFSQGKIFVHDNYHILDKQPTKEDDLGVVVLHHSYILDDKEQAYSRSRKLVEPFIEQNKSN